MADGKAQIKEPQVTEIDKMIESGEAFRFFSPFEKSAAYTEGEGDEKQMFVELLASSDQEDLVGDVMDIEALRDMESTAVGTIMLRDHNRSTEKIFGSIVEAALKQQDGKTVLWIKAQVDDGDSQNIRIWKSISKGVKLGASVTVIVLKTAPKPNKSIGDIIKRAKLLEISIVTIPCNQDAWTLAATASKALQRASKARTETEEEVMKKELETPEAATEETSATPAAEESAETETPVPAPEVAAEESAEGGEPAEEKAFMPRTTAAIQRFKAMVSEVTESKTAKTDLPKVDCKGMFADRVNHPKFWDLIDILYDVYYQLKYQVWNLEYAGETDFSEVETLWAEALDEFKASAVDSFSFWSIPQGVEVSLSLDQAATIQKAVGDIADLVDANPDAEKRVQFVEIGKSMLEVAKKAGIPLPAAEKNAAPVIDVKETDEFKEVVTRAETAETKVKDLEKELEDTKQKLEVTKAGLEVAVEATGAMLRQPLSRNGQK